MRHDARVGVIFFLIRHVILLRGLTLELVIKTLWLEL